MAKFKNIGDIAATAGVDKATFWDLFTPDHFIDMIQLGWKPHKYALAPAVVEYIEEVILKRRDRLALFPTLRSLETVQNPKK